MKGRFAQLTRLKTWEKFAEQANYDAKNLAKILNISPRHLQRLTKKYLGSTPQAIFNNFRIAAAKERLPTASSFKELAQQLGHKQESHFCAFFKKWTGLTPSEYLEQSQQSLEANASAPDKCRT